MKYINDKPKTKFYSGVIGNHNGISFCSGSGYFLSKDLVELIVSNEKSINHGLIDDVSFAEFLIKNEINLVQSERFDVDNSGIIPMNFFHYRLKTENRFDDINNMRLIFSMKCK